MGTNTQKTHPQAANIGYMFAGRHSELDAYIRVPSEYRGKKLVLWNYRFNAQGVMRNAKPCSKCMPWVQEIFSKIIYSTNEGMTQLV